MIIRDRRLYDCRDITDEWPSQMAGQHSKLWQWSITHSGHWIAGFTVCMDDNSWRGSGMELAGSALMEMLAGIGNTKVNVLEWDQLFFRGIFAKLDD